MKRGFFLLLRLICYLALALGFFSGLALVVISVNGQCPPLSELGVTCATRLWQGFADFGLAVNEFALDTGFPIVLAVGGLIFLMRDLRLWRSRRRG